MNVKESLKILERRFEQKNLLFISGNVYDTYMGNYNNESSRELISLMDIIKTKAEKLEYENLIYFRPSVGKIDLLKPKAEKPEPISIDDFLEEIASDIENTKGKRVYAIELSDIYFSSANRDSYLNAIAKIISAITIEKHKNATEIILENHKVIFIMRDQGNIIKDLSYKNNEFGQVIIALPDRNERSKFFTIFARSIGSKDCGDLKFAESDVHEQAVTLTAGMSYKEILQFGRLSEAGDVTFKELYSLARFNHVVSDWEKLPFEKVKNLETHLKEDVKGQAFAINNVSRVLRNALLGVNGVMTGVNNKKPKGILFFSGPTGVGKTELAKSLTRFVFGDENRMIRFDMSEFGQEHSDQRLIGAPPGYVGYDSGGELTNAVRDEPQSIILFDEIEKAHPKILDKFLQILEDGRLTSSQGELIDFSETMIIFTSNIGADKAIPLATGNKKGLENQERINRSLFIEAVENKFRNDLKRPEILNRIGKHNIIPFNFITDDSILKEIYESKLKKLCNAIKTKHNLNFQIEDGEDEALFEIVKLNYDERNGGRGLISAIEVTIQNSITNYIFANPDLMEIKKKGKIKNITIIPKRGKLTFETLS